MNLMHKEIVEKLDAAIIAVENGKNWKDIPAQLAEVDKWNGILVISQKLKMDAGLVAQIIEMYENKTEVLVSDNH